MKKSISVVDGILCLSLSGDYSYHEMLDLSTEIRGLCQSKDLSRVLLDLLPLDTFLKSDLISNESARLFLGEQTVSIFSELSNLKGAISIRREKYNGFFEHIVQKHGLNLKVFFSRKEAVAWLTADDV